MSKTVIGMQKKIEDHFKVNEKQMEGGANEK